MDAHAQSAHLWGLHMLKNDTMHEHWCVIATHVFVSVPLTKAILIGSLPQMRALHNVAFHKVPCIAHFRHSRLSTK